MKTRILTIFILIFVTSSFSFSLISHSLLPTSLKIKVVNSKSESMQDVTVTLYGTEKAYRAGQNPLFESKKTDKHGLVVFKKLKPEAYYIHAVKGNASNMGEKVLTDALKEGRINKVTTLISHD
ncbi:MAG: hypothetical protein ACI9P5_004655 [Saprospiraceae bacterium]|jgi:hypothetical protein